MPYQQALLFGYNQVREHEEVEMMGAMLGGLQSRTRV